MGRRKPLAAPCVALCVGLPMLRPSRWDWPAGAARPARTHGRSALLGLPSGRPRGGWTGSMPCLRSPGGAPRCLSIPESRGWPRENHVDSLWWPAHRRQASSALRARGLGCNRIHHAGSACAAARPGPGGRERYPAEWHGANSRPEFGRAQSAGWGWARPGKCC